MQEDLLIIEKAKNNSETCRYNINGKWKYLYSKYKPERVLEDVFIREDIEFIIVLGLGLGYELKKIRELCNKRIIVIEYDQIFYRKTKDLVSLESVNCLEQVEFYFGDSYKEVQIDITKGQLIVNDNLIQCNIEYYNKVINHLYNEKRKEKVIGVFNHPTILNDCTYAFEEIGYKVIEIPWSHDDMLLRNIAKVDPDYLFSINFSHKIAKVSEKLDIPYISWTVDTPAYSLYDLQNLNYRCSYFFVYDEKVVNDLRKKGIKNIFYMPVAANVKRLEEIVISQEDNERYDAEVAFVGSSCINNEFLNYIKPLISTKLNQEINDQIKKQVVSDRFILRDLIDDTLVEEVARETNHIISYSNSSLLASTEKLAFILGRYHSYIERVITMNELSKHFDLNIYGDDSWLKIGGFSTSALIYRGHAEHFYEMPKVFKVAKVNLNITRSFVETGLPMRVFDVLGSGGFLVSNDKYDISRLFREGRDLVIYRDLKDLIEIINYYLEHDDEREMIKRQGLETTKKEHSYVTRISKIMKIVTSLEKSILI